MDTTRDEILGDGIDYDKKDAFEVAIGDGMEFTIHGKDLYIFHRTILN